MTVSNDPPDLERMRRLGEAYDISGGVELGVIADAIISEPNDITPGGNDKDAILKLLSIIVTRNGVLAALGEGKPLDSELVTEMEAAVASSSPAIPADLFVNQALGSVRAAAAQS